MALVPFLNFCMQQLDDNVRPPPGGNEYGLSSTGPTLAMKKNVTPNFQFIKGLL